MSEHFTGIARKFFGVKMQQQNMQIQSFSRMFQAISTSEHAALATGFK